MLITYNISKSQITYKKINNLLDVGRVVLPIVPYGDSFTVETIDEERPSSSDTSV